MSKMDRMMEFMLVRMSKEEKDEMMDNMMGKFFADMTADDKQKMMAEMMPKIMEGMKMRGMMPAIMMCMIGDGGDGYRGDPLRRLLLGGNDRGRAWRAGDGFYRDRTADPFCGHQATRPSYRINGGKRQAAQASRRE